MSRTMKYTAQLFLMLIIELYPLPTTAQEVYYQSCSGQITKITGRDPSSCEDWVVQWRHPDGRVWGMIRTDSYDKAVLQRDKSINFHKQYAKFFNRSFDPMYSNPLGPICRALGCTEERSSKRLSQELRGIAQKGWDTISTAVELNNHHALWTGKSMSTPFDSVGASFREYTDSIAEGIKNQHLLRGLLLKAEEGLQVSGYEIERQITRYREGLSREKQLYGLLSSDAKKWLGTISNSGTADNTNTTSSAYKWASQGVRYTLPFESVILNMQASISGDKIIVTIQKDITFSNGAKGRFVIESTALLNELYPNTVRSSQGVSGMWSVGVEGKVQTRESGPNGWVGSWREQTGFFMPFNSQEETEAVEEKLRAIILKYQ